MQPRYIFIVGLPRTGTKLMMNILESCQDRDCQIAPENFFLGRFLRRGVRHAIKRLGDMSDDSNVSKLVDWMYSGKFWGLYWSKLADGSLGVDKEAMLQRILDSDRSEKEIYSILLQMDVDVTDRTVLGDKTGPHLYRVPMLLEWFPEAKVVHTFRDPRAVLASEHKKRLGKLRRQIAKSRRAGYTLRPIVLGLKAPFYSLTIVFYITFAWLWAARLHYKYARLYPNNYYLSRFEDLVQDADNSIKKLCEFLDIEFHFTMLNPPKIGSSFAPRGGAGFNEQTLDRWQGYLKPWMKVWLRLWAKRGLKRFGYLP